ncbi:MAG: repressor [Inoviridae sp.]|nr:MAG: repressor [Inoviridae sp.]
MPTKHIDDATWRKVESETVKAVTTPRAALKDTEVLKILILKGLQNVTEGDYIEFLKKKKRV